MALAIQSNLALLRDADARLNGVDPAQHDISVPDVREVVAYAETLIDGSTLTGRSAEQVHLRLHEVWGQFCLMCWLFSVGTSPTDADLASLDKNGEMRCETALETKHAEVHALFWRIVFEQRRRSDAEYVESTRFAEDQSAAERIPAVVLGTPVGEALDAALLLASCEHAGMLATLRWVMDARRVWGEPGLVELDDRPF